MFDDRLAMKPDEKSIPMHCLYNYLPFQTIHRIIDKDISILSYNFKKNDCICIISDAALLSSKNKSNTMSKIIGVPERPCLGMEPSYILVKKLDEYLLEEKEKISTLNTSFNLRQSISMTVFSEIRSY